MPITNEERSELLKEIAANKRIKSDIGWHNFSRNVKLPNALLLDVDNRESLQQIMRWIYKTNLTKPINKRIIVRVAAGGQDDKYSQSYSFTAGVESDVVIRLTGKEFRRIERTSTDNVMRLGGNLQIGDADQKLYDKFNLVMPTSSLIPYVTVAGLSANAGHGTGKDQPSFAGLIRAMTLCLSNGEIVRIDESHPDFETIRGAHLGLFGIVLNIELQCVPAKKLQCVMEKRSLPEFLNSVKTGLYQDDYCVSVMYVPTYQPNELDSKDLKNVIIYRYRPVDKSTADVNYTPCIDRFTQDIQIKIQEKFQIDDLLLAVPSLIPEYMRYLVTRTAIGDVDQLVVGPWPMFHYQTAFPHQMNDMSYLFPVKNGGDNQEIIVAYTKFAQKIMDYARRREYPIAYATYGRYLAGTNGGLSTSAHQPDEHVFGFDMVSLPGLRGFQRFRQEMSTYFLQEMHAKPHWGKYVPENVNYSEMYGDAYQQFMRALHKWHVDHRISFDHSPFLNDFACRILNVPMLAPETDLERTLSQDFVIPEIPVAALAKAAALCVQGDDEYACQLRRHLNQLSAENRISRSSSSLFGDSMKAQKGDSVVEHEKDQRRCCVII